MLLKWWTKSVNKKLNFFRSNPKVKASVFWDFENCHIPKGMQGHKVVRNIRSFVLNDKINLSRIIAIGNIKQLGSTVEAELEEAGVLIQNINSGKESAADMAITLEILKLVLDSGARPIYLITGDRDFSKLVNLLESIGSQVTLIHNRHSCNALKESASRSIGWENILQYNSELDLTRLKQKYSFNNSEITIRSSFVDIKQKVKHGAPNIEFEALVQFEKLIEYLRINGNAPVSISTIGSHPDLKGIYKRFGYSSLSVYINQGLKCNILKETNTGTKRRRVFLNNSLM